MYNIHLNLYYGFANNRGYKFAKVLKSTYDKIYLSGVKQNQSSYFYEGIKKQKKIIPIYLNNNSYLGWVIEHIKYFKNKKITSISVHNLNCIILGVILKFIFNAKLIYEPHELETETLNKKHIKKILGKIIEKIFIRFFDYIIVVSPSIANWYSKKYNIRKPSVIYNSLKKKKFKKYNLFRSKFHISKKQKIFLYNGNLNNRGRGLEIILQFFITRKKNDCIIIFMGKGEMEKKIKNLSFKSKNVFYHKPVSIDIIHKYTSSADVGLCLIENTCLNENYCLPNKLFEYVSGRLPILASNLYELKKFINKNKIGFVTDLEINQLKTIINEILIKDLKYLSYNSKKTIERYDWKQQENKILQIYRKLLSK